MKRNFIAWGISILLLLTGSCTKVMDLSDEVALTGFKIKSITPSDIELGKPIIKKDTVYISVNRGVTLFPMSISAQPEYSGNTEQAVTGTTFESFNDIKFDLGDIHFNTFYLVAKSGFIKPYYIKLIIEDQLERNDFKELAVTGLSQPNAVVAPKGFINPVKRTINLYAIETSFPLEITAAATLSDSAYIKDQSSTLNKEDLKLKFNKYGDNLTYIIEAENGAKHEWKISLEKATEAKGTESSDIKSALSFNPKNQSAEVKTPGYKINGIAIDNETGKMQFVIAQLSRNIKVEILPNITTLTNSQLIGYKAGESVFFENYSSTNNFIILDVRTGYYKKWKFALKQADIDDIRSFPITYSSAKNYIVIDTTQTYIDSINKIISLKVTKTTPIATYWPLIVTPGDVKCSPGATLDTNSLVFANIEAAATFKLTSLLGETEWTVKLLPPNLVAGNANIDSIKITSSSHPLLQSDMLINANSANVFIDLNDKNALPLRIQPFMYISDKAEFGTFQNGDFIEFNSFEDVVKIDIISRSGKIKTWNFQLLEKSQLYNSDFELWNTGITPTIDPIPGRARGWATANNVYIKGTMSVNGKNGNGKAAEMTTSIISALPKDLITAGTLFLGYFDMSTISLDKPRDMTKFGVPFEAKPIAVAVDAKYIQGPKYQKSVLVSGSGISARYKLEDLKEGGDKGQIWIELIHYSGSGQLNYNGEPAEGVTVLARGEHVIEGSTDWNRLNIPLARKAEYDQYQPTHIVVVMASSIEGHLFIGAKGSKLTVDNFELIY